jgi:transcriptional regulator with XRE-family HTH domain
MTIRKHKMPELRMSTAATKKMRAIMKRNGLSQVKLAEILGITQGSVSNWFNVTGSVPREHFEVLKKKGWN